MSVDPVRLAVASARLRMIAEQMHATLIRTAFSPNIKERADCSTGLLTAEGRIVAQSTQIPLHLGSLLSVVEAVRARFPAGPKDGDIYIVNDPYTGGGTHLPDVTLIAPAFADGTLVAWAAAVGHHSDIGGRVPGGQAGDSRTIFEEGLRIPPVRLAIGGEVQADVMEFITINTRTPSDRIGDLRAQIAAVRIGIRRVAELATEVSVTRFEESMQAVLDYTARRLKARVAALPDGTYEFADVVDDIGIGEQEATLRCVLTISGDRLSLDFTGTDPQFASSKNIGFTALQACVYAGVKTALDPSIPPNSGYYDAIDVYAPAGCFVNPLPPAAVGERAVTTQVLGDVIHHVLTQADPTRAMAACGPYHGLNISGWDPRRTRFFVSHESYAGGLGARVDRHGMDSVRAYSTGSSNLPVEVLEQEFPLLVERYELRDGSGGQGRTVGGRGVRRDIRVLGDDVRLTLRSVRQRRPAWGIAGGSPGLPGEFVLNPETGDAQKLPATVTAMVIKRGDVISVRTPGGGGWGPPDEATTGILAPETQ
jgi:N-methylhydantoinase B